MYIYLSPSTQEGNIFVDNSGSEEYYMNLIADAMLPYLTSYGIYYNRNSPNMSSRYIAAESNRGNYDLHVAIHSNASPEGREGENRGPKIYYYADSVEGKKAAELIADEMKKIYPDKDLVEVLPNKTLIELNSTKAPAVFVETAFHDNVDDASFIKNNIDNIARAISNGINRYGGKAVESTELNRGKVTIDSGVLNVRNAPNTRARIIGKLKNGDDVTILKSSPGCYLIRNNSIIGYVSNKYVKPS
ncbi:MAG: N-acetylmuramoyl-L-alanine amidase [Clostridiales bacterium]|nr:N-acetylmuramoyl-L-alanine amidase [Clostridiales bacterium]